jgi:hypothetical protein
MRCALVVFLVSTLFAADPRPAGKAATPRPPDQQIEAAIRAKFAKSKIAANHFTVRVQGGVATIEGKTDVVQHKGTATRLAKTGGAVAVNNKVQVSEAARAKASKNLKRAEVKRGEERTEGAGAARRR